MKKYRRYERMIALFLLVAFLVLLTVLILWTEHQEPKEYKSYTVKDGDTLWGIASKQSNMGGKMDTRDIIDDILLGNDIGNEIHPGDILMVPQY